MVFTAKNIDSNTLYLLLVSAARNTCNNNTDPNVFGHVLAAIEAYKPLMKRPELEGIDRQLSEMRDGQWFPLEFSSAEERKQFFEVADKHNSYYCTDDILLYALRYAVGRQTYITGVTSRYIQTAVPKIETVTLRSMNEHLKGCIARNHLGDPQIDAPDWLRLAEVIDAELRKRESRKKENNT